MSYTLKYNHPHFPEGTIFNVAGLDRVPNGGTLEIDEEMERFFLAEHGKTLEDAFKNDHAVTLSGSSSLDPSYIEKMTATPEVEETETEPEQDQPAWLTGEGGETDG